MAEGSVGDHFGRAAAAEAERSEWWPAVGSSAVAWVVVGGRSIGGRREVVSTTSIDGIS